MKPQKQKRKFVEEQEAVASYYILVIEFQYKIHEFQYPTHVKGNCKTLNLTIEGEGSRSDPRLKGRWSIRGALCLIDQVKIILWT